MMYNFAGVCIHLSPDLLQISKPKQTDNVTSLTSNTMISQKTSVLEMKKKVLDFVSAWTVDDCFACLYTDF